MTLRVTILAVPVGDVVGFDQGAGAAGEDF